MILKMDQIGPAGSIEN